MGVYVKGMEMPTNCSECAFCGYYGNGEHMCDIIEKAVEYESGKTSRRDDCPLVPVPPHGDLIDRKTAYDSLLDGMVMTGYQSRALDCISGFYVPTIIPAEEGET